MMYSQNSNLLLPNMRKASALAMSITVLFPKVKTNSPEEKKKVLSNPTTEKVAK
jgi:hypothetical protein